MNVRMDDDIYEKVDVPLATLKPKEEHYYYGNMQQPAAVTPSLTLEEKKLKRKARKCSSMAVGIAMATGCLALITTAIIVAGVFILIQENKITQMHKQIKELRDEAENEQNIAKNNLSTIILLTCSR